MVLSWCHLAKIEWEATRISQNQ